MKNFPVLVLLVVALFAVGCSDDESTVINNPVEPTGGMCAAPAVNASTVTTRACAAAPCVADFAVQVGPGVRRIAWAFPGGSPSQSDQQGGAIQYPAFGQYRWSSKICSSRAQDDVDDVCCTLASGIVVFDPPAVAEP